MSTAPFHLEEGVVNMIRPAVVTCALTIAIAACSPRPPEQDLVADAVAALGGDGIARATTLAIEGEGAHFNLGQDMTPEAASQSFRVTGYTRVLDVAPGRARMRVEQTRTPNFLYYQGQDAQTQRLGLDGGLAYAVLPNGNAVRSSDSVAADRRAELYHHPVPLLRAALEPGASLANARAEGTERLVEITTPDKVALTLAIDAGSSRPTRISSRTYHPNLGDVIVETRFAEYADAGGLSLPSRLTTSVDGFTTADLRVTRQTVGADVGDLAAPASVSAAPAPAPQTADVTAVDVAPGIWLLGGASHNSALVEFRDHLMLVEAPQSEARTLAVIAKARSLRPDKPLTTVLNTHHHFDHSAGIRAAVSEGLAVITHKGNAAFIEAIVERPHTLQPDALAKKPAPLDLRALDDGETIGDESMSLVVYTIAGNPHSDTMLMAYVPRHRLLIQADAYSGGFSIQPYAPNLIDNVARRKLRVDRVLPMHGEVVPYAEVLKFEDSKGRTIEG